MLARSDDITMPWRGPETLNRNWRGMAWALVLSVALHLSIAGPLFHLMSRSPWESAGPVLSIELSKFERVVSAEDHESKSEKPQPPAPARPVSVPPPRPVPAPSTRSTPAAPPGSVPVTPRVQQRTEQRTPDSKPPAAPVVPVQAEAVETPVAPVSKSAPATRAVEQTSSASTTDGALHEPDFQLVYSPQPSYPRLARRLGLEGRVVLGIWVSANGVPDVIVVKESSGYESLDVSAREGVRKWRFENRDGASVEGWVTQPVTFRLE